MPRRDTNEGRVYLRRSSTKQESSLLTQLEWAIERARSMGVPLRATPADLDYMQRNRLPSYRDIFLDDAVGGSRTSRPGFDAMLDEVRTNRSISHLFVFKRDRLGRPRDPIDMMAVDRDFRNWGVWVEMSDGVIGPVEGSSAAIGQNAMALFDYHESGEFSKKLSERVVRCQASLARQGYSTGGRPIVGGLPLKDADHDCSGDPDGRQDHGGHKEHPGKARCLAGGNTAPSRRRGKSTGPNGPSRGGGATTPVDSENPRQPSRTDRLSIGTSGGPPPPSPNDWKALRLILAMLPQPVWF